MWWAQAYLCLWAFFFYIFQRFMHLRVCKKMYCTSNKLDSMVLYFGWGLLLAELAACHAYWRVRLQEWRLRALRRERHALLKLFKLFKSLLNSFNH